MANGRNAELSGPGYNCKEQKDIEGELIRAEILPPACATARWFSPLCRPGNTAFVPAITICNQEILGQVPLP